MPRKQTEHPNNKADEIKTLLLSYWRFQRGCSIVATEFNYGEFDVISYSDKARAIYETEVKVSIGDMRRERKKSKHRNIALWGANLYHFQAQCFYFAVPESIQESALKVCQELFPYAGLLIVHDYEEFLKENPKPYAHVPIREVKEPRILKATENEQASMLGVPGRVHSQVKPITEETILRLAKGMSNTLCKMSYELMLLKREKRRR